MKRKRYAAVFKARVAIEAIRGDQTISQIAARFEVHSSQVNQWKKQALLHLKEAFSRQKAKAKQQEESLKEELYSQIGRLKVENDWLKKNLGSLS